MLISSGYAGYTAFWYLRVSKGFLALWSLILAIYDIYCLMTQVVHHGNDGLVLITMIDWAGYRHIDCARAYNNEKEETQIRHLPHCIRIGFRFLSDHTGFFLTHIGVATCPCVPFLLGSDAGTYEESQTKYSKLIEYPFNVFLE